MAILLYNNGIIEDYNSDDLVFSEEELVFLFAEFKSIKTTRLLTVLNTWCIYGEPYIKDPIEYHKIASVIAKENIFSHVLFVHDSELNPAWNSSESILYKSYDEFDIDIRNEINNVSLDIAAQIAALNDMEETEIILPQMTQLGITPDKKIMLGFNPNDQEEGFFDREEFLKFSKNVYEFISQSHQTEPPYKIYEDKKAVIVVEKPDIKKFLNIMLEKFKNVEEYEICTNITNIINDWAGDIKLGNDR